MKIQQLILALLFIGVRTSIPQTPAVAQQRIASPSESSSPGEDVVMGEPFEWALPRYPKSALEKRTQGDVALVLSVDKEGNVSNVSVISGDPELADSCIGTIRKWKYVPYDINEKAAVVTTRVAVQFRVTNDGRPDVSVLCKRPQRPDVGPLFTTKDGIKAPKAIHNPPPSYSKEAKDMKYQGICVLGLVVGADGKPYDIKVARNLGFGLDQRAIEAVRNWKFQPGTKDGKPVAVAINVTIQFVLQ